MIIQAEWEIVKESSKDENSIKFPVWAEKFHWNYAVNLMFMSIETLDYCDFLSVPHSTLFSFFLYPYTILCLIYFFRWKYKKKFLLVHEKLYKKNSNSLLLLLLLMIEKRKFWRVCRLFLLKEIFLVFFFIWMSRGKSIRHEEEIKDTRYRLLLISKLIEFLHKCKHWHSRNNE